MQQYEHVESTPTVITYTHSRSCLQWMFITAEPFGSMRVPTFKFLTYASESYRVFINLKGKSGKEEKCAVVIFQPNLKVAVVILENLIYK